MTVGRTFLKTIGLLTPFMLMQPAVAEQEYGSNPQDQDAGQQTGDMKGKEVVDIEGKAIGKVADVIREDGRELVVIKAEELDSDEIKLPATRVFRNNGDELQVLQSRSQLEETGSPR